MITVRNLYFIIEAMLSRSHKLNSREFRRVFQAGRLVHSDFFTLKYLPTSGECKVAVVVSKKHSKSAVTRNYLRRLIYNTFKHRYTDTNQFYPALEVIVMLKKTTIGKTSTEIQEEFEKALAKISN